MTLTTDPYADGFILVGIAYLAAMLATRWLVGIRNEVEK